MQQFQWVPGFETGIDVVDSQHKRIFEYILEVDKAIKMKNPESVKQIARSLIDYSISHNAFEETLMERAGYPILDAHAKVHEAFRDRALSYNQRLENGEDCFKVAKEVRSDIGLWLTNHIQRDDKDYVPYVRKSLEGGFVGRMVKRFFA
ncbi:MULTISPECIES: bacteriohemerythrin [unclassified Oceanobacter]|jgi:hemerythrin|uniref:bacteriohemerythrin n=1 Tax=unclassified Oceanobacter TaxID=2620260 RepID=UPI0026E14683|nr:MULTISPECIES: bacteriohemerythrin [unclassified Oceanobacter]MDO6681237.1 bacteriohemerythrin [Oceanobacter sp. 5_MG-2023]MDP2504201.1 bacteriohemerythrin [Oceanobacter sp. 3_MG-2023]MDP2546640.1 bacteriohemerythrin [Oceanobacter sp. 4_MG-2023]MDP2608621.1 bacteriohemerythrin [Oceanobacter sp. 1_MG-2023]MDP2611617.1 bacteriohemerythrin [Oceanobacter sp. 2_MG-2023]